MDKKPPRRELRRPLQREGQAVAEPGSGAGPGPGLGLPPNLHPGA